MDFTDEMYIRGTLRQGTVYYIYLAEFGDWHYFVVLNRLPLDHNEIYLVYSSSKVEKVKRRIKLRKQPLGTCVEVKKEDYEPFTEDSAFDCNTIITFTRTGLEERRANGSLQICDDFPSIHLNSLCDATRLSPKATTQMRSRI